MKINITYYLEITSSWCYWAEPAWAKLKQHYAQAPVEFNWEIALLDQAGLPTSRAQVDWFYRRSGTIVRSPFMLNSGWWEPECPEYLAPNCVALAAKDLEVTGDRVRLALAEAGLREGLKITHWEIAAAVAAQAAGIEMEALMAKARSPEMDQRVRASTAAFHALQVTQRPAFVLASNVGDRAVFSDLAQAAPMIATIDAMLNDAAAYAAHAAHFGGPPAA